MVKYSGSSATFFSSGAPCQNLFTGSYSALRGSGKQALAGIFVFGETDLSSKERVASEDSKQATHRLLQSKVTCRGVILGNGALKPN